MAYNKWKKGGTWGREDREERGHRAALGKKDRAWGQKEKEQMNRDHCKTYNA